MIISFLSDNYIIFFQLRHTFSHCYIQNNGNYVIKTSLQFIKYGLINPL